MLDANDLSGSSRSRSARDASGSLPRQAVMSTPVSTKVLVMARPGVRLRPAVAVARLRSHWERGAARPSRDSPCAAPTVGGREVFLVQTFLRVLRLAGALLRRIHRAPDPAGPVRGGLC